MNYYGASVLALFDLLFVCSRTSAYYNKSYGEYRLTIRDGAGYNWATQLEAQQWCRDNLNGSLLASVTNSGVQTTIQQFVNDVISDNGFSENYIILNAQLEVTDWQWLNGQGVTTTDVQGQSDESNYRLYAYLRTTNNSLIASKPSDKRSYLCQNSDDANNCGENGFRISGRCYIKYDSPRVTWFDARSNCQNGGGDLASFDQTGDDLSQLNSSPLYPTAPIDYWVGLKRLKWIWLDTGSEANYTYWTDSRPSDYSKKCLCLSARNIYNWTWIDCDCNQNYQFICLTAFSTSQSTIEITSSTKATRTTWQEIPITLGSFSSSMSPNNSYNSYTSKESETSIRVGLGVGLGVGIPLVIATVVLGVLFALKTKQLRNFKRDNSNGVFDRTSQKTTSSTANDRSLNDIKRKQTEADAGKPNLRGTTTATNGEVANPYEPLRYDAGNNDRLYQELSSYETVQTDS